MQDYRITLSNPDLVRADEAAVVSVLRAQRLSLGPRLPEFERRMASYVGARFAVAVNSGTSGLHLIVRAMDLKDGDEVITTPFSFVASSNCLLFERAKPVFADIEPRTLNIDPDRVEASVTPRTRAILAVDVFGHPARWDRLRAIARRHRLRLIEDSCEAIGATFRGRKAGTLGEAGVFAFYPNKQITCGEGGVIVTDDAKLAALCTSMRNQGRDPGASWLQHARMGFNYRLTELQCALAASQLDRIGSILARRERVARRYAKLLAEVGEVELPQSDPDVAVSWFVYVVRLRKPLGRRERDAVIAGMARRGVQTSLYFAPIHLQPFYRRDFGFRKGMFPVTESVSERTLALPFYTRLSSEDQDEVVAALKAQLRALKRR